MIVDVGQSVCVGIIIYILTAWLLGRKKATFLPGGVVVVGLVFPLWYVAVPAALLGHACAAIFHADIAKD